LNRFELNDFSDPQLRIARGWFFLGIFSLLTSGIFSLLLVLSRTPAVSDFIPWIDFFHTALVVHVDLSVLIWFLSFTAIFWSLNNRRNATVIDLPVLLAVTAGTLMMVITPFTGQAHPILNNYIPVLNDPLFLSGLVIIGFAFAIYALRSLLFNRAPDFSTAQGVIRFAIFLSVLTLIVTLFAQLSSYQHLDMPERDQVYYEYLFWGSGHTLQFSHTILLLVSWMWLSNASGSSYGLKPGIYAVLFVICFLPVVTVPFIYNAYPVLSPEHRVHFTELMRWGGLASLPLGAIIAINVFNRCRIDEHLRPARIAFVSSVVLFLSGGILGFMIDGVNVVIPAHYHGSIVGVTLAFMGMAYLLLPILGYRAPQGKWVNRQPMIYATGQMMHIIGLAWSGGYGVQRKTAGAAQGLDSLAQKAGMGLMGLGGLVAIIGGTLFLVIVLIAIFKRKD